MQNEYVIAFSSFYKAAYAQDLLEEEGIKATLRKLPIELAKACSTGIYLKRVDIEQVKEVFEKKNVHPKGIYLMNREDKDKVRYSLIR